MDKITWLTITAHPLQGLSRRLSKACQDGRGFGGVWSVYSMRRKSQCGHDYGMFPMSEFFIQVVVSFNSTRVHFEVGLHTSLRSTSTYSGVLQCSARVVGSPWPYYYVPQPPLRKLPLLHFEDVERHTIVLQWLLSTCRIIVHSPLTQVPWTWRRTLVEG